jgi:CheY-like chemotaxis protein
MPKGRCISLSITDTGSGIPNAMLGQIFEPFITTKEKGRGTGLGLAVVHRIVTEHGGAILVTTRNQGGTRFEILLPLSAGDVEPRREHLVDRDAKFITKRAAKILVVDDDEAHCTMVQTALRRDGYSVQATNDPRLALDWLKNGRRKWDLVVTDQTMPHIKGRDLVHSLKAVRPEIFCIICTGYSSGLDEQAAMAAGADGFMLKPFNVGELSALVARLLARKSSPARPKARSRAHTATD